LLRQEQRRNDALSMLHAQHAQHAQSVYAPGGYDVEARIPLREWVVAVLSWVSL
jgi:hypothetical protein